jgi:hypothetical protein
MLLLKNPLKKGMTPVSAAALKNEYRSKNKKPI